MATAITNSNSEEIVQCPYDPSHRIIKYKLHNHLVKCKRNHPDADLIQCKFNLTHLIPSKGYKVHLETCPDRIKIDQFMMVPENVDTNKYPIPQLNVESEENWDNECVPSYQPLDYCLKNPILRTTHTLSYAQRRDFKYEHRQHMQKFINCQTNEKARQQQMTQNYERQPKASSAGFYNTTDVYVDDVSDLLEKVKLGAKKATTPKLQMAIQNDEDLRGNSPLSPTETFRNEDQMFQTTSNSNITLHGVHGYHRNIGRGRGSALVRNVNQEMAKFK